MWWWWWCAAAPHALRARHSCCGPVRGSLVTRACVFVSMRWCQWRVVTRADHFRTPELGHWVAGGSWPGCTVLHAWCGCGCGGEMGTGGYGSKATGMLLALLPAGVGGVGGFGSRCSAVLWVHVTRNVHVLCNACAGWPRAGGLPRRCTYLELRSRLNLNKGMVARARMYVDGGCERASLPVCACVIVLHATREQGPFEAEAPIAADLVASEPAACQPCSI